LEPWITPSIFENVDQSLGIIDEFTLTQKLSRDDASGILNAHWSTFYTFRPFSLQSLLFQACRFSGNCGGRNQYSPHPRWCASDFISRLTARILGVFLGSGGSLYSRFCTVSWPSHHLGRTDRIEGLDRSPWSAWWDPFLHLWYQRLTNGYDNSGRKGPIDWPKGPNIGYTQQALQAIIGNYSVAPYAGIVVGIEVLNEPNGYVIPLYTILVPLLMLVQQLVVITTVQSGSSTMRTTRCLS